MMKAAIRADGNSKIGFGHIVRTQALASRLGKKGAEVIFLTKNPENIQGFKTHKIPDTLGSVDEDDYILQVIKTYDIELMVVDSYAYNQERLDQLGNWDIVSVYIDDMNLYEFNMDFVVNGNLYAPQLHYQGRAAFLLGTEFLLLREPFCNNASRSVNHQVANILITFGAADANNLTVRVMNLLLGYKRFNSFNWHIVIGPAYTSEKTIEVLALDNANITLHRNPDMKNLMDNTDICISAAGSSCYELAACGVPAILMITADNQRLLAEEASRQGVAVNLGWYDQLKKNDLFLALDRLIDNYKLRQNMGTRGQETVDGYGAERVAELMVEAVEKLKGL